MFRVDSLVHLIYQDPLILIQIIPKERTQILAVSSGYSICEAQENARERAASPLTRHLLSRTTPSSLAPGPMLSKTSMFVHVIVLDCCISLTEWRARGIFIKRENSLLRGLKWTTFKSVYNLTYYFCPGL